MKISRLSCVMLINEVCLSKFLTEKPLIFYNIAKASNIQRMIPVYVRYVRKVLHCYKYTMIHLSNSTIGSARSNAIVRIFVLFCRREERQFQSVRRAYENARWPGLRGKYSKYEKSAENERWATERIIDARDRCRRSVFSRTIVFSFRARWSSRRSRFVPIEYRGKYWCTGHSIIRAYAMRVAPFTIWVIAIVKTTIVSYRYVF